LLQDGVSSVVAMSHTVLVETARRFVGAFYGELVRGRRIGEAMLAGQRELKNDDFRGHVFKGELRLQDWFVPILFQEEDDPALVETVLKKGEGENRTETLRLAVGKIPEEPDHTFVGRSRELLAAERLLARERYVVLRGEGGEGKTTLAAELVRWLVRTRRFERAAFVSLEHVFDERSVLWTLGDQLVDGFASEAGKDEERARKLLRAGLAATPTILVFDNMETALASDDLVDNVLVLARELMRQGETRLVFTTREPLPDPFARHHLDISRLGRVDAVALVARVLGREDAVPHAGDEGESDDEIVQLVDAVRGHARSLVLLAREVAASGVRRTTLDLRGVLEGLHERYGDDRERSLLASVELSLRRLPTGMRERIRPLAVFHGGGHLGTIAMVLGLDTDKNEHSAVRQALVGVGLGELLSYGYLRLHPALGPALDRELSDEERSEARQAWVEAMVQLVTFLYQQQSQDAQMSATLTILELPNLLAVLERLRRDAPAEAIVNIATQLEGLLQKLGRPKALAQVVRVREEASKGLGEWSHAQFQAAGAAVDQLLEAGRFAEAVEGARTLLELCPAAGEGAYAEASYDVAIAHFRFGRTLLWGGSAEAALTPLAEARTRFEKLGEGGGAGAARMARTCVIATGDCLRDLGQLDEASRAYETSIELAEKLGNRRDAAVGRGQLGTVRMLQRRFDDAIDVYTEARATFEALGEGGSVASMWHQIGCVYQEAGQLESAEETYQQALKIDIQRGDRLGEATTLSQLGNVYSFMGRREEAVRFCRQAVEVYVEIKDFAKEGLLRNNIADVLIKLRRYDEARQEILRAIECKKVLGHSGTIWNGYNILHKLERAVGDDAAAVQARERAVQAFLAYRRAGGENLRGGHGHKLCGLVGQAIDAGNTQDATTQLAQLQESEELPEYLRPVIPVLLKVLAGSRDPALASDRGLDYDDEVEILLLLEALEASDVSG
jgi:tetratricopeptide (TPR) repeat protein